MYTARSRTAKTRGFADFPIKPIYAFPQSVAVPQGNRPRIGTCQNVQMPFWDCIYVTSPYNLPSYGPPVVADPHPHNTPQINLSRLVSVLQANSR